MPGALAATVLDLRGWRELPTSERHLILRAWLAQWRGALYDVDLNLIEALDVRALGHAASAPLVWPRVFGDGAALSGILITARRATSGEQVTVVFLLD